MSVRSSRPHSFFWHLRRTLRRPTLILLMVGGITGYLAFAGPAAPPLLIETMGQPGAPVAHKEIRPGAATSTDPALAVKITTNTPSGELRTQIVAYAATLLGTPYQVGGKDEDGFDCSGFIAYVFHRHGVELLGSTQYMVQQGQEISQAEAQPGDVVFFTGTAEGDTQVGHAGIVVENSNTQPLRFIHSSSSRTTPGVKYSSLGEPGYQRRYLMVRRMLP